jgi:hypothetical protein
MPVNLPDCIKKYTKIIHQYIELVPKLIDYALKRQGFETASIV